MSGHSKWSTIKHRKGAKDAKRGKLFTKVIREIVVATKEGGSDPDSNTRLRSALLAAKSVNMPKDTIQRAIKRAGEGGEGEQYVTMSYEGYGPHGSAMIVRALTDNKNRTAADVRSIFHKHGGKLGESGSVAYMFEQKGAITVHLGGGDGAADDGASAGAGAMSEDQVIEHAIDSGVEDYESDGESVVLFCGPKELHKVAEALSGHGVEYANATLAMLPTSTVALEPEKAEKSMHLIESLEDLDDIQEVYSNLEYNEDTPSEG